MRFHIVAGLAAFTLSFAGPASAGEERVIDVDSRVLAVTVDDEEIPFEIAPDAPNSPVLAAETARRLGLKGSLFKGVHLVGRTKLTARSNRVKIDFGDGERRTRRAFFFESDWHELGGAMINPASLSESVVTYRLRDAASGERVITLPLLENDIAGFHTELVLGEERVPTFFSFARPETMATAAAGALLASGYDGQMTGEARPLEIEFGIARPVRTMKFSGSPALGELRLANIVVRSQDTGSTDAIPDDERDPNEIVVVGGKAKPIRRLWVGTDSLAACSSLTFDREAQEIRLSCAI
ncbi:hypothetical protein [Qipengyuania sphaerica]|uniref:hypothetical protein n=1 Tax=Qipengyuania sphaerica TaxID=2867243 RepID=UPI001C86C7B2|nr:hypothetical protein [Qipengyuania sphaerica]MBX7539419.1 hypothetical protein [Qipengyuania sphaerica]